MVASITPASVELNGDAKDESRARSSSTPGTSTSTGRSRKSTATPKSSAPRLPQDAKPKVVIEDRHPQFGFYHGPGVGPTSVRLIELTRVVDWLSGEASDVLLHLFDQPGYQVDGVLERQVDAVMYEVAKVTRELRDRILGQEGHDGSWPKPSPGNGNDDGEPSDGFAIDHVLRSRTVDVNTASPRHSAKTISAGREPTNADIDAADLSVLPPAARVPMRLYLKSVAFFDVLYNANGSDDPQLLEKVKGVYKDYQYSDGSSDLLNLVTNAIERWDWSEPTGTASPSQT